MEVPAPKDPQLPRRGYSDEEIVDIFQLGRSWLETGHYRRAEAIMSGLNDVAPQFAPAWLGSAFLKSAAGSYDAALRAAKIALQCEPESVEAMLYVATLALTLADFSTAGTYLGEVGERIEQGKIASAHVPRLYKMQLARYQARAVATR
jgi:hypothetical protein